MEKDQHIRQIELIGPETSVEINRHPFMGFVFLKAVLVSLFRPNTIADDARVYQTRIVLKNHTPDKGLIQNYKRVCKFSSDKPDIIPMAYLQTLFIGLLGKFITSSFFPVNPLGLIQVFQSLEQKRPVRIDESLDLSCRLSSVKKTEKGLETSFSLDVASGHTIVWQGISTFFTRSRIKKKKPAPKPDRFLEKKESILVPCGMGRRYAAVSKDYNPHHLFTLLAKLFGFKSAIAHGMWSLARVLASLDRQLDIPGSARVEAAFKLPIFMPATIALGYEYRQGNNNDPVVVDFELRDDQKGLPHLKGVLLHNRQGS